MSQTGGIRARAFVWLQYLLPQHGLSRLVLAATRVRAAWFKNAAIRGFLQLFQVDMSEAIESDPYRYGSFNEFFTRALKPGARPVAAAADAIACPVDGCISEAGAIDGERLLQAKGRDYRLDDLLAGQPWAQRFQGWFLRDHLSGALRLPPRAHAVAGRSQGYGLHTRPLVQRQRRHGAVRSPGCLPAMSVS